jgi:glycosyltransferase involved in cell wall biosynthesis
LSNANLARSLHRIEVRVLEAQDRSELHREDKAEDGVTIFIPTWNHKSYLPRSIQSALSAVGRLEEAGFSAEIIVIDDASRDGSQKLLRTIQVLYNEPRLKITMLEKNLGLPRLRNLALQMSRFRYMCLMDADNELLPDNLPLFLQSIKETGAALVYGNLIIKQNEEVVGSYSGEMATMRLTAYNYIDAFSIVDANKLLRLGGYTIHPQVYGTEDWEMVLHLIAEEEKLVFVPIVMGYYHRLSMSMIQEPGYEERNAVMQRMFFQSGTREWDPIKVGHIYHPSVGYIDDW